VKNSSAFRERIESSRIVIDPRGRPVRPIVLEETPPELRDNLMLGANVELSTLNIEEEAHSKRRMLSLALGEGSENGPASEHDITRH
jgi:hypothetical protein